MKVLFINTVFGRGSTGRIISELGQALEAQGDEYMVAYGRGEAADDRHGYRIGRKIGTYLHAGLSRITDRAGFYSTTATKRLIAFLRDYQPDIIHLHNLHGYYINIHVLFDYLKNEYQGGVVWTLHDVWPMTGHCASFLDSGCERWKTGCGPCAQKHEYPKSVLFDRSERNYLEKKLLYCAVPHMKIVTVSNWLKQVAEQSLLQNHEIRTIYNGIDTTRFKHCPSDVRTTYKIGEKYLYLAVSDGWGTGKGFEKVLELSQCVDDDSVVVVIGLSKGQMKGLPKNVIGMARTWNQQELIRFYSAADVFFNPSKGETFGLVTAEAMACGTPAIVYRTTACPEIVGGEACGRILDLGERLPKIVKEVRLEKSAYSANCRERVASNFSLERMKDNYRSLYHEMISSSLSF